MQFVRRRRSVRESSEKQKKELKKTLDTVGVVRDSAFIKTLASYCRGATDLRGGRGRCSGGRSCRGLGDNHEFERFSVDLELHFIFVEGELDSCI